MKKKIAIAIIIFSIVSVFYYLVNEEKTNLTIKETEISVDLAITKEEQIKGLSGRKALPSGTGMLFIYNQPRKVSIWMKDMNFPIDIIWIDDKKQVSYFKKSVSPDTYPESFAPNVPVRYVLEVPAGFVEENYIQIGDNLEFEL
jgi:uncharacterized membrane protein (UPF0127 family)